MDAIYKTYERFIEAAKKFPRWNNTRRRPTTSVGGALLRSIIEEIGKVEDAILDYKNDFFIVNYIDREDKIVDYLYNAYVGDIENLNHFTLEDPNLKVTNDINDFYKNVKEKAYYQNGYIIFKNPADSLAYIYNNYKYIVKVEKFHIWNVYDEFAWWSGIERFKDENNKSLLIRTINQFHKKTSSSEAGLKNVIFNAISGTSNIEKDEIIFEQPNEKNLYLSNNESEELYEEISKFNRDIARTKQWDIDYWDNSFRTLHYISHPWDVPVENYQDGVGYNNSLYVSTIKDLNIENETDVVINGYKKSTAKIEEYIKNNNLNQNIELNLTKYSNTINPIFVQYKIEASTLTEIQNPEQIYIDAYKTSKREITYSIDSLYKGKENITITPRNKLEPNKHYVLKMLPRSENYNTMETIKCQLKHSGGTKNLLTEKGSFGFNDKGLFVNKSVLLHADSVTELNSSNNLADYRYGGFTLEDKNKPGTFEVNISKLDNTKPQPLIVSTSCDLYNIMTNPTYIKAQDFTLINGSYISGTSMIDPSILTIELKCRDLSFELDKEGGALSSGYVNIETYIDGVLDKNNTYYNASVSKFKKYELTQYGIKDVKVVIKRNTSSPIKISNISVSRYEIKIKTDNGIDLSPNKKESITIPANSGYNYLEVTINNYGQTNPIINCVHIGAKLNILTSVYKIDIDTTGLSNSELIIDTNCRCDVYLQEDQDTPIDFNLYNLYTNKTTEYQAIYLDLSSFKEIYYSYPEIKYSTNDKPYVMVKPGESIDSIIVYGNNEIFQERNDLKNIFKLKLGDKLYLNKNIKGFIVKNSNNESFLTLPYNKCSSKNSDTYKIWSNNYKDLEVCYISNSIKNVESITDKYSGIFEYVYIYSKNSSTSVAYNSQNIIKNETTGINIVKNFAPAISSSLSFLYEIKEVVARTVQNTDVVFIDDKKWTTNINKEIKIKTNIDLSNSNTFNTTVKNLNYNFILSNNIPLEDTYIINDTSIVLAQYIIDPPEHMKVIYEDITILQNRDEDNDVIYVEEDRFNKLLYSNVASIEKVTVNDSIVDPSNYSLLSKEGIICWNNDKYVGGVLKVTYTYKKPKYLTFKDIDYLYSIVGYQIDTLEKIETVNDYKLSHLKEGTSFIINYDYFLEKPDKVVVQCSNPCYIGIIKDNSVIIQKIAEDNSIVIHNGYYYIDGNEYWYFADKYEHTSERLNGITMNNVEKLNNSLLFKQEAENLLKNSKMLCNTMNIHCKNDFTKSEQVPSVSSLEELGICNSFANWESYNMDITLGNEYDGDVIKFKSNDNSSYAVLDITKAIKDNKFLSCLYNGKLNFKLGREVLIANQQISKSLFLEDIRDLNLYKDKAYVNCSNLDINHYRYYLIVTGEGTLIEIMTTDDSSIEKAEKNHVKTISKIGFNIKEEIAPATLINIDFSPINNKVDGLEITKDLYIQQGSSIDWGITKLYDIDFNTVKTYGFLKRKDALISQVNEATVETTTLKINNRNSIKNLYIKINDYLFNDFKDFNISILGSNTPSGEFNEVYTNKSRNLFIIPFTNITNYLKIIVSAKENKIINHIEVFAEYIETQTASPSTIINSYGQCVTKIYDLGIEARYVLKETIFESESPENISIQIRGLKQSQFENIWTSWYDITDQHEFDKYRLFQFKIILKDINSRIRINKFVFEVK